MRPGSRLIDETLAKAFFPKGDAIGQFLIDDSIGEVRRRLADCRNRGRGEGPQPDEDPQPVIYYPALQAPRPYMKLAVRTAGDPLALVSAIQRRVRDLDRNLPVYKIATMEQNLSDSLMRRRFSMLLLAALAGFALCLAAVGVYSVIAYSVSQRTREIGIRMALGAQPGSVHKLILRQGLRPVLAGLAAGLLASLVAMRALASLLYGVSRPIRRHFWRSPPYCCRYRRWPARFRRAARRGWTPWPLCATNSSA
jgi:putative ABC transport system permease protein